MRLSGKTVLITGAAGGQGAAEAVLFRREGARVVLSDVRDDEGRRVLDEISAASADAQYVRLDVTSESDWASAVATAVNSFGGLDVIVNNAGVQRWTPIDSTTADEFHGAHAGECARCIPWCTGGCPGDARRRKRDQRFVGPGLRGWSGPPRTRRRSFAVRGMTKVGALELAARGIRVNSIHPGYVATAMLDAATEGEAHRHAARIPIGELRSVRHRQHGAVPCLRRRAGTARARVRRRWRLTAGLGFRQRS